MTQNFFVLILCLGISLPLFSQVTFPPVREWAATNDGYDLFNYSHSSSGVYIHDRHMVAADEKANIYFAHDFFDTLTTEDTAYIADDRDILLTRYRWNGEVKWRHHISSPAGTEFQGLCVGETGDAYVIGRYRTQLNIDQDSLIQDGQGYEADTVAFYDTLSIIPLIIDTFTYVAEFEGLFLARFKKSGSLDWMKAFHTRNGEGIQTDHEGNLLVWGRIQQTAAGPFELDGFSLTTPDDWPGFQNFYYVAKLDPDGQVLWLKLVTQGGIVADLTVDQDNNIILSGGFSTQMKCGDQLLISNGNSSSKDNVFVAKYDPDGDLIWARSDGGTSWSNANSVTCDSESNIYITGRYYSSGSYGGQWISSNGTYDIILVKYDQDGQLVWLRNMGGSSFDQGISVTCDRFDNVLVAGMVLGGGTFGDTSVMTSTSHASIVTQFDKDGNFDWVVSYGGPDNSIYSDKNSAKSIAVGIKNRIYVAGMFNDTLFYGDTDTFYTSANRSLYLLDFSTDEAAFQWDLTIPDDSDPTITQHKTTDPLQNINAEADERWNLYPNPASEVIQIQRNSPLSGAWKGKICNEIGQTVQTFSLNSENFELYLELVTPGNYFLLLTPPSGIVEIYPFTIIK